MLKLDNNFYVLSRGEQVAKMVEYSNRLTGTIEGEEPQPDLLLSGAPTEAVDDHFIPEFLAAVARHYDWDPPTEQSPQAYRYNIAVLNILKTLMSNPFQDVDKHATQLLDLVEHTGIDGKVRRLALTGLRVLTDPDLPFQVSHATAMDVSETLAGVVISGPVDEVFCEACTATMARLLAQQRVPFTESFRAVAALPQYRGKHVFGAPEQHLH